MKPAKKKDGYIQCLCNYKRVDNKYRQINYLIASNTMQDLFNTFELKKLVDCYIPKIYLNKGCFTKNPKKKRGKE